MQSLASTRPRGGEPGLVTAPLDQQPSNELIESDSFRGGLALARSIRDAWPWFVLAASCLFLGDVFVRRVVLNFDWIGSAIKKISGSRVEKDTVVTARLDALKKNKESIDESLQKRRASVRFEPESKSTSMRGDDRDDPMVPGRPSTVARPSVTDVPDRGGEQKSYTERLLEAKRKANKRE